MFTTSPSALYEEFRIDEMASRDVKLSIIFQSQDIMEESLVLLRFNCPDDECVFVAKGWNDLKIHVRAVHNKFMW